MFTVEQRDALREHLLRLAEDDQRIVAGAAVGSLALGGGDRFSDLDLTFAIADHVPVAEVLNDWTRTLVGEQDAVRLADLERGPTIYRVFLLPDALQFDLSLTPAAQFRPAGPRFRLLFGETAAGEAPTPHFTPGLFVPTPGVPSDVFGWGVIYALLPAETLARFEHAHVGALAPGALRAALAASVRALMHEGAAARLPHSDTVAQRLGELS